MITIGGQVEASHPQSRKILASGPLPPLMHAAAEEGS
jgi:hypothetical protein